MPTDTARIRFADTGQRASGRTRDPATAPPARTTEFNVAAHGLRGLAALMVLFAHILGGTARHVYQDNAAYVEAIQAPWYLGTFGVQLFFVISGFVILPSALRYRPREFALRRFLRLYPLFIVLSLAFVALNAATNAYPKLNTWSTIVSGLLFLNLFTGTEQLTPNAWSLTYEVMFYVLVCAVVESSVRHRARFAGSLAILMATAFVVALPMALYFVMGVAIRIASQHLRMPIIPARLLECISLALMIFFASRGHFEYHWRDLGNPVVVGIIVSTGLYFWFAIQPQSLTAVACDNKVMRYFGTVSYSLYLVHPYVYFPVRTVFERVGLFTTDVAGSIALFGAIVAGLSILAAHLAHVTLELWPYQRFFRQKIYRTSAAKTADVPAS
jgi:peptidoglycan/LPS O-acetylase OafA/YrhL